MLISPTRWCALFWMGLLAVPAGGDTTTIAVGGLYGGPTQAMIRCYVFNPGTVGYFIQGSGLIAEDGNRLLSGRSCAFPITHDPAIYLEGGRTCQEWTRIAPGSSYGCYWSLQAPPGTKPVVRGTLDIRDADNRILISAPLR
jgi:hypothetical protein